MTERFHPLVELLKKVVDHLMGKTPRLNFRRLFMATCRGNQCPELDRHGVTAARPTQEMIGKGAGFWCPIWAWPYVRRAMKEHHLARVKAGKAQPMATYARGEAEPDPDPWIDVDA